MSDPVAPAAAPEAPAATKPEPAAKPVEAEPSEEYEVDGQKVTLTATQRRTAVQKGLAADKRIQTAAETQKKLDALISDFEKDPEAALAKMGKDPEKILAALMERKAKQALLTPEQREAQALKEERDALKAEKDERDKESKAKADQELDQHNYIALSEQLVEAADRHGLDGDPETLEGMADVGLDLLDLLGPGVTAEQVAQEYMRLEAEHLEKRDRKLLPKLKGERLKAYLKTNIGALLTLPAAELLEMLGPEGVKVFQAATLTKLPGVAPVRPRPAAVAPPPRNGAGRFTTEAQFDKKFR